MKVVSLVKSLVKSLERNYSISFSDDEKPYHGPTNILTSLDLGEPEAEEEWESVSPLTVDFRSIKKAANLTSFEISTISWKAYCSSLAFRKVEGKNILSTCTDFRDFWKAV